MTVFFGCRKNYFCIKEFDRLLIILQQEGYWWIYNNDSWFINHPFCSSLVLGIHFIKILDNSNKKNTFKCSLPFHSKSSLEQDDFSHFRWMLCCNHSNETSLVELLNSTIYFLGFKKYSNSNFFMRLLALATVISEKVIVTSQKSWNTGCIGEVVRFFLTMSFWEVEFLYTCWGFIFV